MSIVWLIGREIVCWYYKINSRIELKKEQIELQKKQLEVDKDIRSMLEVLVDKICDVEEE